jgi:hypothetical protein
MTTPLVFVVFTTVAPDRNELEVAAIRVERDTLAWQIAFTGRELSMVDAPGAPRAMSRAELAAGVAAAIRDARLVAWNLDAAEHCLSGLLAAVGRTERIRGVLDLATVAEPYLDAAGALHKSFVDVAAWMTAAPPPHRALALAAAMVQLYGRVRAAARTATALGAIDGDEARIAAEVVGRLAGGRPTYGPWQLDGHRDLRREALHEVVDGLHYAAAELVRTSRRRRVVYVATALPPDHAVLRRAISELLTGGALPLLPWQVGPQLLRDGVHALDATRMLLETADEVRVVGDPPGDIEVVAALASALDVPVVRSTSAAS